jgi:putative ABC transport system substrate-binding protein
MPDPSRSSRRAVAFALTLLVLPLVAAPAVAQAPARVPVVGVLSVGVSTAPIAMQGREALEVGLRELGWTPGHNVHLDYRYAGSRPEQLDLLARELVRVGVDVIVARSGPAIHAARKATATVPIVMSAFGQDPVQVGLVGSLGRPGGNITGLTLLIQDLQVKQLQLLKEVVPRLSRVALLGSRALPITPTGRRDVERAAGQLGLQLQHVDVGNAGDLDDAFAAMVRDRVSGLLVRSDPFVLEGNAGLVVALALSHRLPAVYWLHSYPQAGGLMSYGADLFAVHQRSAFYVDRILRGTRPADLPVEEPSKLALYLNLGTAKAIGLTIPPAILNRASELIR